MLSLSDREWGDFSLVSVFDKNQRGKRLKKADHTEGSIPYVSSTAMNNGVDGFIEKTDRCRTFENCISLNNSGSVGKAFYQPFEFVASDHVTHLKKDNATEEQYLFLTTVIEMQSSNFSFNREINDERLAHMRIMLPVDAEGNPDWGFMGAYIQERKKQIVERQIAFLERENLRIGGGRENFRADLRKAEWREFSIADICIVHSGVRLTKADMLPGYTPFVGSSDSNNGVTAFTGSANSSLKKNVLGVNYNGSVVVGFYHAYDALFSDDVKQLEVLHDAPTEYMYLFLKVAILKQKSKYAYGYKFNAERMKRQIILLPATAEGNPDWEFMEGCVRALKRRLIKEQLGFLKEK